LKHKPKSSPKFPKSPRTPKPSATPKSPRTPRTPRSPRAPETPKEVIPKEEIKMNNEQKVELVPEDEDEIEYSAEELQRAKNVKKSRKIVLENLNEGLTQLKKKEKQEILQKINH